MQCQKHYPSKLLHFTDPEHMMQLTHFVSISMARQVPIFDAHSGITSHHQLLLECVRTMAKIDCKQKSNLSFLDRVINNAFVPNHLNFIFFWLWTWVWPEDKVEREAGSVKEASAEKKLKKNWMQRRKKSLRETVIGGWKKVKWLMRICRAVCSSSSIVHALPCLALHNGAQYTD